MAVSVPESVRGHERLAYRRILVPLAPRGGGTAAVSYACRLAADHGATVTGLVVVQVPSELPLDAHMFEEDARARRLLAEAEAVGDLHGVTVERQVVRARGVAQAILDAAEESDAELIVLRTRRLAARGRRQVFGKTAQFVLNHARCRVLLSIAPAP